MTNLKWTPRIDLSKQYEFTLSEEIRNLLKRRHGGDTFIGDTADTGMVLRREDIQFLRGILAFLTDTAPLRAEIQVLVQLLEKYDSISVWFVDTGKK